MRNLTLFDKTCTNCQQVRDALTDFYRQPMCRDGLNGVCKLCYKRRKVELYEAQKHTPEFKAKAAANRKAQYQRRLADPELMARNREQTRRWRAKSQKRMSEQYRTWRLANADRVREKNQRRRARLLDAYVAPVDPAVIWERDGGICQLCHTPVDPAVQWPDRWCGTIDHIIPLSHGGTHEPGNVQLAHHRCNSQKNDRPVS